MNAGNVSSYEKMDFSGAVFSIHNPWDLFVKNAEALNLDFEMLSAGRQSTPISNTVTVIGSRERVFLEEGAIAEACILNTTAGPVYLGKNSEVMEGAAIRGPFSLGEGSTVKMNAKIYGATTIGPHCKMGGEISNSVVFGYSNKAHDGFLGNSVIGEWCNLGADTNNSNLKNNYANVNLYSYSNSKPVDTGLQFCGLIMGDHSKSGINTMFNTGTVAGVGCNIFGGGFPPVMIPNFSWGGSEGFSIYNLEKFFETAGKVYERRGLKFTDQEKSLLRSVFENTV
jgi:UDP-N-acetylglucosamine diphosphorylase/glucosamine-1-phosphate N-acetyltransferase